MVENVEADAAVFERIRFWKDFRPHAAHIFATDHALRWFIRKHDRELVESGALLKLPKGTYIDPVPFAAVAINLMRYGQVDSAYQPDGRASPAAGDAP